MHLDAEEQSGVCLIDLYPQNSIVLWMHKESVFTLKWDALAGEEGITKGAPTNIYALQSP